MKSLMKKTFINSVNIFLLGLILFSCSSEKQLKQNELKPYVFKNDYKSKIFDITVNGKEIPVSVVPKVDQKEAAKIVESYKKLPEYCWIESRYATAHYIHFAVDSVAQIHLRTNETIKEITVYPKRTGVNISVKDNIANFSVNRNNSKYYLVSVNKLPMFVILLEEFENNNPKVDNKKVVSLKSFTNKKNISDYTEVFEEAISTLNGTGKTLYIPAGEY